MTSIIRFLAPRAWLTLAVLAAFLAFGAWCASRERRAADVRDLKAEVRAGEARETAATERAADAAANIERLQEWNHDAAATPDALPDDRELRRRCRQLRDAGRTGLAECRGFEA